MRFAEDELFSPGAEANTQVGTSTCGELRTTPLESYTPRSPNNQLNKTTTQFSFLFLLKGKGEGDEIG
jgi:hypothetical protein